MDAQLTPEKITEAQRAHDEIMRQLRAEFSTKVWPKISKEVGHRSSEMPAVHQSAWLGFLSGKNPTESK